MPAEISTPRIWLTGATGFLGSNLSRTLIERGFLVVHLGRKAPPEGAFQPFELSRANANWDLRFAQANALEMNSGENTSRREILVHAAWQFSGGKDSLRDLNVRGSIELIREFTGRGGEVIFVSSMAAHEGAQSNYGRMKLAVEQAVANLPRVTIVRPGTVLWGGGVTGKLQELVTKFSVLPIFFGGHQKIQTIHVEDFCEAVARIIEMKVSGFFNLANFPGLTVREFYQTVARHCGKNCILIPAPGNLTLWFARLFERWGYSLPITSDNLLGLKYVNEFETEPDLRRLRMKLRPALDTPVKGGVFPRSIDETRS